MSSVERNVIKSVMEVTCIRSDIPKRQVHLDFHTSGLIDDVGIDFNAEQFGKAFSDASVNNLCLFTRCHHGYCYYPTSTGTMHPGLHSRSLLDEQIAALDAVGVGHSLYTTVCWDELSAENHPDWLMRDRDGMYYKMCPEDGSRVSEEEPGWRFLCWNSGYRGYLHSHIREVCERYQFDELLVDIVFALPPGCFCDSCRASMAQQRLDINSDEDVNRHTLQSAREFMKQTTELIRSYHPDARIWYNSRLRLDGCAEMGSAPEIDEYMQYIVIESLPSGFWGYNHFPLYARYCQNLGYPMLSQTGRFQKMWGDFGGLKNQVALDYECLRMLSMGCACGVGDQLHPSGRVDAATYDLIGRTFAKIEEIEPFAYPSTPVDEIGVVLANTAQESELLAETGAMRMLTERQFQFSIIDETADLSRYKVIILPDNVCITDRLGASLQAYLAGGGKLLVSGTSGRSASGDWAVPGVPVIAEGAHPYSPYYAKSRGDWSETDNEFEHVLYTGGHAFAVNRSGWDILATVAYPYFNRTHEHFCSHLQSPPAEETHLPELAIYNNQVAVIGASIFGCYARFANRFARDMVETALDRLLPERIFRSNLPSTAEVTVRDGENRRLLHLLHYVPQRRGESVDIVEDVLPLVDIDLSVEISGTPKRVSAIPGNEAIPVTVDRGRVHIHIPRLDGYKLLVIEYAG